MDTMKNTKMQPAKDAVIEELRELAEDLYVNGYNRYSSAMSQGADEIEQLRAALRHEADCVEAAKAEIDALRAKIAEMEKQEPVASVWRCDNGHIHGSCERTLPMGAKLYALPGAKGEEK